jgi:hypothetical protein
VRGQYKAFCEGQYKANSTHSIVGSLKKKKPIVLYAILLLFQNLITRPFAFQDQEVVLIQAGDPPFEL